MPTVCHLVLQSLSHNSRVSNLPTDAANPDSHAPEPETRHHHDDDDVYRDDDDELTNAELAIRQMGDTAAGGEDDVGDGLHCSNSLFHTAKNTELVRG